MSKHIAILRGINVGGKRKVRMADLKAQLMAAGLKDVQTYIQSGNVIFSSATETDNQILASIVEQVIAEHFGLNVPVIVLSAYEIHEAVSSNPLVREADVDINRLHLTFLKEVPDEKYTNSILASKTSSDQFVLSNKHIFVYCVGPYHKSKLSNSFFEKHLHTVATTRNWKTVLKLAGLAKENG